MIQRIYYEQSSSAAFQLSKFHFKSCAIILSTSAAVKLSSESLTVHSLTERSQSQISKQHNEMEFFRMTF